MQRAVAALVAVALLTASYAHMVHHPYTDAAAKKVYLIHFHEQVPGSQQVLQDQLLLVATDPVPVEEVIPGVVLSPGLDPKALQVCLCDLPLLSQLL